MAYSVRITRSGYDDARAVSATGTVNDFLTVVSGIIKRWKGPEPPETAHLYFG